MSANPIANVRPDEVMAKVDAREPIPILDVREKAEWISGHIPNAKHIPLGELPIRYKELDRTRAWVVVCHSGSRSRTACEWLADHGFNVSNMMGGMSYWQGQVRYGRE